MSASAAQVRQWSEEVAADRGSLSFLPLARAYREQGRREAAQKLCIRGLERHPDNVEAHYLLGLLYREGGDTVKAFDEWDIALALSPEHAGSRREIGLLCHARGDWGGAVRHLEKALELDSFDQEVRSALEDAWARRDGRQPSVPVDATRPAPPPVPAAAPPVDAVPPAAAPPADAADPFTVVMDEFHAIAGERGIAGAVLLDDQGFVLAGEIRVGGSARAPDVAAVLSGASPEAERALRHLGLGGWKGILVETPEAIVRIAPAGDGLVAVAGSRQVPTGWVLRVAARARESALKFLGGGA
ncbi:MAG: tetratricopeptide repeat protein [Gemmatimonadetes bacterium]|nr:tetratricopeptide repeat protein [Gemmatimonadota bacterium]